MSKNGLQAAGYEYINIGECVWRCVVPLLSLTLPAPDDCWAVGRDTTTHELIADPKAFPDGMAAVADYVHKAGFKFGMYTDRGPKTCAGRPASGGYEGRWMGGRVGAFAVSVSDSPIHPSIHPQVSTPRRLPGGASTT